MSLTCTGFLENGEDLGGVHPSPYLSTRPPHFGFGFVVGRSPFVSRAARDGPSLLSADDVSDLFVLGGHHGSQTHQR